MPPSLDILLKSHKSYMSYMMDYHAYIEGVDLDIEQVPVRDYFIPNKFIPIIFKFKNIKEEHWCFETCHYRGEITLNGWTDREELTDNLKCSLKGEVKFLITAKSKSTLSKIKLLL